MHVLNKNPEHEIRITSRESANFKLHFDEFCRKNMKNQLQENLGTSRETLHTWMNYTVGLRPRKNVIASFIILTGLSLNLRTRLNLSSGVIPIPAFKSPPSG